MKDLDEALTEITAIRHQMARSAEFRGYGPATLAATGVFAAVAAAAQALWLEHPESDVASYLTLWVATAALSGTLIGVEMVARSRRVHTGLAEEMIATAVEQFLPAAAAGTLVTAVLFLFAPDNLWMLPGLWQILFSLGVFASCRFLPRSIFAVGVWYLTTGLACLAFASGARAFSPWAMGLPYAVGQLLSAALVLQDSTEEEDGEV
ncbi:MAG: hypothetical protein ABW298_12845 [Candidatus Binatia bacterium]